jgi:hypothetical protein
VFITIINIVAVGYDTISILSPSFNSSPTGSLWYERFAPTVFPFPKSWTCTPSTIQIGQGSRPYSIKLIIGLVTTTGLFDYTFTGFVDQTSNSTLGGMQYSNTAFRDCAVQGLYLNQDLDGLTSQARNPSSSCIFSMV